MKGGEFEEFEDKETPEGSQNQQCVVRDVKRRKEQMADAVIR